MNTVQILLMYCLYSGPGADPEIKEEEGHTYRVGAARKGHSCPCACKPRPPAFAHSSLAVRRSKARERGHVCIYSMHSLVGGSGSMLPQENFKI